jgi:hypothetical protein
MNTFYAAHNDLEIYGVGETECEVQSLASQFCAAGFTVSKITADLLDSFLEEELESWGVTEDGTLCTHDEMAA